MADNKKTIEEVMAQYASEQEAQSNASQQVSPAKKVKNITEQAETVANQRMSLQEAQEARKEEIRQETRAAGLGYLPINVEDLPTGGIFYPKGTIINIRAASGGDIRHWSMMNETELSEIDDALNYIIERCVTISFPAEAGQGTWKDLKDIDRLYLILAVRDFTFTEGHNELKIPVSENDDVIVKKDNITFIDMPEAMLKHYDADKRCFVYHSESPRIGDINIYMPSVGVTQWLKNYIERKTKAQEAFDKDFITVAPMLIKDYRLLNDKTYRDLLYQTSNYGIYEWSLLSKVKSTLEKSITPKLVYNDSNGVQQETALNFRGGLKQIFLLDIDVDA